MRITAASKCIEVYRRADLIQFDTYLIQHDTKPLIHVSAVSVVEVLYALPYGVCVLLWQTSRGSPGGSPDTTTLCGISVDYLGLLGRVGDILTVCMSPSL